MSKKRGGDKPDISIEEYISVIRHSSIPTIVVEGRDDVIVYRRIESECEVGELSVLPVDGRTKLISIFRRWSEINSVVKGFIADRDTWVITGVPQEFQDKKLILTNGYSIENDAYIDANFEGYLYAHEVSAFQAELDRFLQWYAIALNRHLQDSTISIDDHPNSVLDGPGRYTASVQLAAGENFPQHLYDRVKENYTSELRGKSLVDLLMRHLSYKGRPVNHHSKTLLEVASVNRGANLTRIFDEAIALLSIPIETGEPLKTPPVIDVQRNPGQHRTNSSFPAISIILGGAIQWLKRIFLRMQAKFNR